MRTYTQLTREERYQIYILRQVGYQQSEIAQILGRHKATISRELRRNRGLRGYRPKQAHRVALARRADKSRSRFGALVWQQVEALIYQDWSPEQICGRLEAEQGIRISYECIYQYIYADKHSGGDLHLHLRCQKKRRKRYGSYDRRGVIPNQVSIDERPDIVAAKGRFGDWEGDTVIGSHHRGALVTLVERKSLYTVIGAVCRKTAEAVRQAIVAGLTPYKERVHTLTYDNVLTTKSSFPWKQREHRRLRLCNEAHPFTSQPIPLWSSTCGVIPSYHNDAGSAAWRPLLYFKQTGFPVEGPSIVYEVLTASTARLRGIDPLGTAAS